MHCYVTKWYMNPLLHQRPKTLRVSRNVHNKSSPKRLVVPKQDKEVSCLYHCTTLSLGLICRWFTKTMRSVQRWIRSKSVADRLSVPAAAASVCETQWRQHGAIRLNPGTCNILLSTYFTILFICHCNVTIILDLSRHKNIVQYIIYIQSH